MKFKFFSAIVIGIGIFVGVTLWRVDQSLFSTRISWREADLSNQRQSLLQNLQSQIGFFSQSSALSLKSWPAWQGAADLQNLEESLQLADGQWGPKTRKDFVLSQIRQRSPSWMKDLQQGKIFFDSFVDADQKPRSLVVYRFDRKDFVLFLNFEYWQAWIEAFRGNSGDLVFVNSFGQVLAHSMRDYVGQKLQGHPGFEELTKGAESDRIQGLYDFAKGEKFLVLGEKATGTNLFVIISAPQAELLGDRKSLLMQILFLGLGTLLLLLSYLTLQKFPEALGASIKNKLKNKDLTEAQGNGLPSQFITENSANKGIDSAGTNASANFEGTALGGSQVTTDANAVEAKIEVYKTIASTLGHELRGPLSSVLAHLQSASVMDSNPQLQKELQAALLELREARGVISKVLGFSGKSNLEKVSMKIETPLRRALKKLEPILQSQNVKVVTQIESQKSLSMDQESLFKVFENIILNSIESMERQIEKTIEIKVSENSTELLVHIKDIGQGMEASTLEKARDPFFTTRSFRNHLGLGLAEAEGIVREHGGQIQLSSQVGKGTTVELRFQWTKEETSSENLESLALQVSSQQESSPKPQAPAPIPTPAQVEFQTKNKTRIPPPPPESLQAALSNISFGTEGHSQKIVEASPLPPQEPDDIQKLFELEPIQKNEPEFSTEITKSELQAVSDEVKSRLFEIEKNRSLPEDPFLALPNRKIEKKNSKLDEYKISVRRPGSRVT